MTLGEYLRAATFDRWQPGVHDCCTLPGDWVRDAWGQGDPLAEWRGTYRSDAQAIRLITQAGGLVALWERGLSSIGAVPVTDQDPGDVGVIMALTDAGPNEVGAIWTGGKWAFRAEAGLSFAPATLIRAWGPQ